MLQNGLDITNYSFIDILSLFRLNIDYSLTDLQRIKQKLIELHPDKSNMPVDYYVFYKKAFNILAERYKQNFVDISKSSPAIFSTNEYIPLDISLNPQIKEKANEFSVFNFNRLFNELFEKHVQKPPSNLDTYPWMKELNHTFIGNKKVFLNEINSYGKIQKVKIEQRNKFGVSTKIKPFGEDSYFFSKEEPPYIFAPSFAKMQYHDVRKVHRDETVYNVLDEDFCLKYSSLEEFQKIRDADDSIPPMEQSMAENLFQQKKEIDKLKCIDKKRTNEIQMEINESKVKTAMEEFLQIDAKEYAEKIQKEQDEKERKKQMLLKEIQQRFPETT